MSEEEKIVSDTPEVTVVTSEKAVVEEVEASEEVEEEVAE